MNLFPFFRKKPFFTMEENERMVQAIRNAETQTSGEVRVFVESRCRYVDPLDRARELFWKLQMDQTKERNAVLVYVAIRHRQFAVFADAGIHEKVGDRFWQQEVEEMKKHFREDRHTEAIEKVIRDVGSALQHHFPYDKETDKNELPDDIIFGR